MYFTLTAHLNSDAKFPMEVLDLYSEFIKVTVKKNRFTYPSCSKPTYQFSNKKLNHHISISIFLN